jgi:hypothetical protein
MPRNRDGAKMTRGMSRGPVGRFSAVIGAKARNPALEIGTGLLLW